VRRFQHHGDIDRDAGHAGFPVPNTVITSAVDTPAVGGIPHRCVVLGYVNKHISAVDQCQYEDEFRLAMRSIGMDASVSGRQRHGRHPSSSVRATNSIRPSGSSTAMPSRPKMVAI
jgi:hypothetical protein